MPEGCLPVLRPTDGPVTAVALNPLVGEAQPRCPVPHGSSSHRPPTLADFIGTSYEESRGARPRRRLKNLMTNEGAIRTALRRRCSAALGSRTLMVDELGLLHASARIDLAVVGRSIHGYEIKSPHDSLRRLSRQIAVYRSVLPRLTLVVASRHLESVVGAAPSWCGLLRVSFGPRGGVYFQSVRRAGPNPDLDAFKLAHLLWAHEARTALAERGASKHELRAPLTTIYQLLVEASSVPELISVIRYSMSRRESWRAGPRQARCDG